MPRDLLTKEQVEDLLNYIGVYKIGYWKGSKINFCCPIHLEKNPSAGINIDIRKDGAVYQAFHCFACGASGSIPKLLMQSMPDKFKTFKQASDFLRERYDLEFKLIDREEQVKLKRYDELNEDKEKKQRFETPYVKLAPFRSGKETYKYFFKRGFSKEDMKEYMIGRDLENKTVTMPIFWEDGKLVGILGRYIDPNRPKNMRFKIYDFPIKSAIYPLDKVEVENDTLVLVESLLDVIMMRKWNIKNAVASLGDDVSTDQILQMKELCSKVIILYDTDIRGIEARVKVKSKLRKHGLRVLLCEYPDCDEYGKDPSEWGEYITKKAIQSATKKKVVKIARK